MDLTECLFQWLKTFDLSVNCQSAKDLCDGVAISHVLNQICPEYFKTEWLNKIETDCGTNWRLRVSNLRKVYEVVVDFYSEVLDKQIEDKLLPDVTLIGRDFNTEQLALLLQLILGCAINCDRKEHWISIMTNLGLEVQHGIKTAIQRLETFEDTSSLNQSIDEKETTLQRCAELEAIVGKLNNEKMGLQIENEKLSEKLKMSQKIETKVGNEESFDSEAVFQRLNQQIVCLQTELTKTEESKEDHRLNSERRDQEVIKLRQQLDEMRTKLGDFKKLKDELDRLRYQSEEAERCKNREEAYKKKIEDTKRQLQAIEERNGSLTKRICELEEDVKKSAVFKGQIDVFRKQREDLRLKVGEESYRADRAEDETKRLNKKFEELMEEKDKYINELSDLKHELNQYKDVNIPSIDNMTEWSGTLQTNERLNESIQKSDTNSGQLRETLIRLEFENQKLKENLRKSDDERVRLLESQLEDEKVRVIDLESENRLINQKNIKLEAELRDSVNMTSDDQQMQTFQDIIKQKELSLESTKHELLDAQQEITSLKAIVTKKDEELYEREGQYKIYVEKAKTAQKALDQLSQHSIASNPSISSTSSEVSNDVNYWKHLSQQKDSENLKLKNEFEESINLREIEARLMTISFHNLSSHLQRKSAEDRIRNGSTNSSANSASFLARQRQATTRKYNMPTVTQRLWKERQFHSYL